MTFNSKDAAAGALFVLLGIGFGLNAYLSLDLGTNVKMGPGYFPLVLSGALVILGIAILLHSINTPDEAWGAVPWRGMFFILLGPIVFGATIMGLGLVPALAIITFIASFASYRVTVPMAIALTFGLVTSCVAIFSYGLGSPIRLFGPWMSIFGLGN